MKKKTERIQISSKFIYDSRYNYIIRSIVGETLCKPKHPMPIVNFHRLFTRFLAETAPGERVPK
jgi:hypothetical protein